MLPDRVSNPGPLTYESGALPIAQRGLASHLELNESISMTHILAKSIRQFMRYCLFYISAIFSNGRGSHFG